MESISKFRKAIDDRARRANSRPLDQPAITPIQSRVSLDEVESLLRLPLRMVTGLQDLDPASPTYGRRAFVLGVSDFSSDDVLGGF